MRELEMTNFRAAAHRTGIGRAIDPNRKRGAASPTAARSKAAAAAARSLQAAEAAEGGGGGGGCGGCGGGGASERQAVERQRLLPEGTSPSDLPDEPERSWTSSCSLASKAYAPPPHLHKAASTAASAAAGAGAGASSASSANVCVDPRQEKHLPAPPVGAPASRRDLMAAAREAKKKGGGGAGAAASVVPLSQAAPPPANVRRDTHGGTNDSIALEEARAVGARNVLSAASTSEVAPAGLEGPAGEAGAHGGVGGGGDELGGGGGGGDGGDGKVLKVPKQWRVATHAISAFSRSGLGHEEPLNAEEEELIAALGG